MIEVADGGRDERLRRIEAVTDAALTGLDVEDLLDELLDRTRDLLKADTAVILLLDPHSRQLVATAAKGLEEEVRQGFRMSIGRGFAGRIAVDARPLIIENVTPADVVNPILLEKGIRSLLGVPLRVAGEVIGVLHIGTMTPRRFDAADVHLLQLVADRVSMAVRARSNRIDRTAALALQHSLLPSRLPDVPGVDMAARYVPGHDAGVGGDWYDVFTLPSGWLGVVIGDVSGHGLRSAVIMGRLRSALRAYALICDDPAEALTHLDWKIHHFEAGNLASIVYAMIAPDRSTIHISVAGHPRPILAAPGQPASMPMMAVDPPLGIGRPNRARRRTSIEFPPEAVLVCYTDGLVERRTELIDVGLERLCAAVHPGPADSVCATIMATVGPDRATDDIALLAVHRRPVTM
ncbi:MAG TPA: GAF domain-containing SpoIIE family protein phosphatase [Micromonosporaceae bacterium]|nr:GAF domain-containing SpoIIE family protein phosphatase [Micromonosporaceae bacterium]